MRLIGQIPGHEMVILLDSGSSHTFLSSALASKLSGISSLHQSLTVQVANGASISCVSQLAVAEWEIQGCKFVSDLKILSLQTFDMVLGYDWLAQFSPMRIHWVAKWIAIPYQSRTVILQGILSELTDGEVVQVYQLTEVQSLSDHSVGSVLPSGIPADLEQLLQAYSDIFASKVTFPPPRACSHTIPLIPGSRPVSIRPYRFAPALKDEIESQVSDMLEVDLIQHSTSPFSSRYIGEEER
jgi:hypothetical protein